MCSPIASVPLFPTNGTKHVCTPYPILYLVSIIMIYKLIYFFVCDMSIIDFGGYGGSMLDVVELFGPQKCLDNFFMQGLYS
jgi:hypothetical protein